jgi:hypothetical protein
MSYATNENNLQADVFSARQRRHGEFIIMSTMVKSHARLW